MLSSLCPAARQYLAAVSVSHSLSKAMLLFSVELLRLVVLSMSNPPFQRKTLQFSIIYEK